METNRPALPSRQDLANRDWSALVSAMNAADPTRSWGMEDLAGGCFGLWGTRECEIGTTSLVWVTTEMDALPYTPADLFDEDDTLMVGIWTAADLSDEGYGTPDWDDATTLTVPRPATLAEWAPAILSALADSSAA